MKRDALFLIIGLVCISGMSYISFKGQHASAEVCAYTVDLSGVPNNVVYERMMEKYTLEELRDMKKTMMNRRNPFAEYEAPKPAPKKVFELPKPREKAPEPVPEVVPPKVLESYGYRGTMMIQDKKAYVVERESDNKMFFVNREDKIENFVVLETNDKNVILADSDKNVYVLERYQ